YIMSPSLIADFAPKSVKANMEIQQQQQQHSSTMESMKSDVHQQKNNNEENPSDGTSTSPNVCPLLKRNAVTFSEETLLETLKESLSLKNSNEVNTNTNTTNINNQVESLSSLIPSSTTKIVSSPSTTNSTILTQTLSSKSTTS